MKNDNMLPEDPADPADPARKNTAPTCSPTSAYRPPTGDHPSETVDTQGLPTGPTAPTGDSGNTFSSSANLPTTGASSVDDNGTPANPEVLPALTEKDTSPSSSNAGHQGKQRAATHGFHECHPVYGISFCGPTEEEKMKIQARMERDRALRPSLIGRNGVLQNGVRWRLNEPRLEWDRNGDQVVLHFSDHRVKDTMGSASLMAEYGKGRDVEDLYRDSLKEFARMLSIRQLEPAEADDPEGFFVKWKGSSS